MDSSYTVIFKGSLKPGWNKNQAKEALVQKFKLSEARAESLVGESKLKKIKGDLSQEGAEVLARKLITCGLSVKIIEDSPIEKESHQVPVPDSPQEQRLDVPKAPNIDLATLFAGECPKSRMPMSYRIGLVATFLLTALLPLIYISIVIVVAYLLVTFNLNLLDKEWFSNNGGTYISLILKWFAPTFIGIVLLIFLIKPLFSTYRERPNLMLSRASQEQFHNLVYAVCDYIGAPRPHRIYVDNSVNAYAKFEGGFKGVFTRKLSLGIGLPLVNGMQANQLVGVIAHEFGHFTQAGGMTAGYFINSVNAWLASRAHERDSLDEMLEVWLEEAESTYWFLILLVANICIKVVRYLFALMLNLSVKISFYLSRQMEYDADSYEVAVAGSENFSDASLALRGLAYSEQIAHQFNEDFLNKSEKIFEDFPAAVAEIHQRFSPTRKKAIEKGMRKISTTVWDTHPADIDRIKRAKKLRHKGVFHYNFPAKLLFDDVEELNKKVSIYDYMGFYIYDPKHSVTDNSELYNEIASEI